MDTMISHGQTSIYVNTMLKFTSAGNLLILHTWIKNLF